MRINFRNHVVGLEITPLSSSQQFTVLLSIWSIISMLDTKDTTKIRHIFCILHKLHRPLNSNCYLFLWFRLESIYYKLDISEKSLLTLLQFQQENLHVSHTLQLSQNAILKKIAHEVGHIGVVSSVLRLWKVRLRQFLICQSPNTCLWTICIRISFCFFNGV